MKDDEDRRLNNKNGRRITNVDTVDEIDRLEMMMKQRKAKKEQLTNICERFWAAAQFFMMKFSFAQESTTKSTIEQRK